MRRRPLLAAATLVLAGVAAAPASRQIADPPLGYTGGFGEPSCLQCHIGSDVNAFGGTVGIDGLPEAYTPGKRYVLTVVLSAEETAVAGFQLAARHAAGAAAGRSAGTLHPVDDRVGIGDSVGVAYAHHTVRGSATADASGANWTFEWTAPPEGGTVRLHVAANSGNGDESPLGDLVFTHAVELSARR